MGRRYKIDTHGGILYEMRFQPPPLNLHGDQERMAQIKVLLWSNAVIYGFDPVSRLMTAFTHFRTVPTVFFFFFFGAVSPSSNKVGTTVSCFTSHQLNPFKTYIKLVGQ